MSLPLTKNKEITLIEEVRIIRAAASSLRSSIENRLFSIELKLKELQEVRARVAG